ncbi:hypothetical protein cand_007560 [Cryptosporidium andersoni]|uniref:Uncharacterized protein n=1 Tax=Cryptosporidium andersoni TaxID=117008 RepID=A0A1J4MP19_9CRYT|nr:hypothetical protein cand_007560 [Cryptosporidium andersoni]
MPGVYEKQCRGPRYDHMVTVAECCNSFMKNKQWKEAFNVVSQPLLTLCNDFELIEEFFYSGIFECCCELLTVRGLMSKGTEDEQDLGSLNLIIEQFSLLSSLQIQSYDEEIGEISMLIYFLTERHRYYIDIHWKSHELTYMGLFLKSHFTYLISIIEDKSKNFSESPSLLLITLKNIDITIRGFPPHRITPSTLEVLIDQSTWDTLSFSVNHVISSIFEISAKILDIKEGNYEVLKVYIQCLNVLYRIISFIPIIGTSPALQYHIVPSVYHIGIQRLLLSQYAGSVITRCACSNCEKYRKIQKLCRTKEDMMIVKSIPLIQRLVPTFNENNGLNILCKALNCIQGTISSDNFLSKDKQTSFVLSEMSNVQIFINMLMFTSWQITFDKLKLIIAQLMQMIPRSTKTLESNSSNNSCFIKRVITNSSENSINESSLNILKCNDREYLCTNNNLISTDKSNNKSNTKEFAVYNGAERDENSIRFLQSGQSRCCETSPKNNEVSLAENPKNSTKFDKEFIEILTCTDDTKYIINGITSILLQQVNFPIYSNGNDIKVIQNILELICPTYELILRKLLINWNTITEEIDNLSLSTNSITKLLEELKLILSLSIPLYLKHIIQKNISTTSDSKSKNIKKSIILYEAIESALSQFLNFFNDLFKRSCQAILTNMANGVEVSEYELENLYNIGIQLIGCFAIITDVPSYNWTTVTRRRFLASPYYEICGWMGSEQHKLNDFWAKIFSKDRCVFFKEVSQIIQLRAERAAAISSIQHVDFSLKEWNKISNFDAETDDEFESSIDAQLDMLEIE